MVCKHGRIYSKQGPVQKKKLGARHLRRQTLFFLEKNWRPFLVITVAVIHITRSLGCRLLFPACKTFAAPLVGAPVRPNMLNMPKSAAVCKLALQTVIEFIFIILLIKPIGFSGCIIMATVSADDSSHRHSRGSSQLAWSEGQLQLHGIVLSYQMN